MNHPNEPTEPTNPASGDTAWEEAMSRDFDARVRHLHEAPLDFDSVKGKAHKIKRNRRAAVAGGILGVAAIVTPIAVLSSGGDEESKEAPFVEDPSPTVVVDPAASVDYVVDGVWHQADGNEVKLPKAANPYSSAVIWNDQLVATYWDGEVYSITDVIDGDGTVVDSFDTASSVAVNETGTTVAWIGTDGTVMTAWGNDKADQVSMGEVDLAAAGETVAYFAAAVTGGPNCYEVEDGCIVYVNSGRGDESRAFDSHGINDIVAPSVTKVFDATDDGVVSVINEVTDDLNTCGGLLDMVDRTLRWDTCDYQVTQISPDGNYVAAPPSQYDGLGPTSLSVLDAQTGEQTGTYGVEGGFVGTWAWTTDGQLLFDAYDGASWHLISMAPENGAITEIGDPVKGEDFDSPFTLIQH
jgi:hypothetical protein